MKNLKNYHVYYVCVQNCEDPINHKTCILNRIVVIKNFNEKFYSLKNKCLAVFIYSYIKKRPPLDSEVKKLKLTPINLFDDSKKNLNYVINSHPMLLPKEKIVNPLKNNIFSNNKLSLKEKKLIEEYFSHISIEKIDNHNESLTDTITKKLFSNNQNISSELNNQNHEDYDSFSDFDEFENHIYEEIKNNEEIDFNDNYFDNKQSEYYSFLDDNYS
jgi:hypothetical protein